MKKCQTKEKIIIERLSIKLKMPFCQPYPLLSWQQDHKATNKWSYIMLLSITKVYQILIKVHV